MISISESKEITIQNDFKQFSNTTKSFVVLNALPKVTVQTFLHVPNMWNNDCLLPAYFVDLEKYLICVLFVNNTIDENMRFACLSNVMSPSQAKAYGLVLSGASGIIEP